MQNAKSTMQKEHGAAMAAECLELSILHFEFCILNSAARRESMSAARRP
jgi:hypothetical protein